MIRNLAYLISSMYPGVPPREMIKEVMTDKARKQGNTRWQLSLCLHCPTQAVRFPPATQLHCSNIWTHTHKLTEVTVKVVKIQYMKQVLQFCYIAIYLHLVPKDSCSSTYSTSGFRPPSQIMFFLKCFYFISI